MEKTELRTPIGKRLHFRIKPRAGHMESGNAPTAMATYMSYTNASRSGVGNRTDPLCQARPSTHTMVVAKHVQTPHMARDVVSSLTSDPLAISEVGHISPILAVTARLPTKASAHPCAPIP